MTDTLSGQIIAGRYKLIKQLGRGGMAEVYLARQESLDRDVAIKLMHTFLQAEGDFLHRFKREAKAMAALNHPHIVSVYDFDAYGQNSYYLVMEYIGGGTLKEKLEGLAHTGERLPIERAVQITLEVLDALAYAHARGMVHRDIKPANIMLDENDKAIITDFGIVKMVGGQSTMAQTATGALIGTPSYMSPEQALGKPGDERVDIYSVGVLLFQMVTGQLPFTADTPLAVVMKHVSEPVPMPVVFNPDIPAGLQSVIVKAMAKEPDDRYPSAREMAKALRAVNLADAPPITTIVTSGTTLISPIEASPGHTLPGATVVAPPVSDHQTSKEGTAVFPPSSRRIPWLYVGIGAIVLLLIAALLILPGLGGDEEEPTATVPVIVEVPTNTDEPTETPEPVPTATSDIVEPTTINELATLIADLTRVAQPTHTPTPSITPSATATSAATEDATAVFLANCLKSAELVDTYPYQNPQSTSVPVGVTFPVNWILENSGECPWPVGLQWIYVEGEDFNYDDPPVELTQEVLADQEVTLTASFVAPTTVGTYESTWQLVDASGQVYGEPLTFEIRTYIPVTNTPRPPTPAPVTPTPTTVIVQQAVDFSWFVVGNSCIYQESDWQCTININPFGGGGGPYTIFVFDQPAGQATQYRAPWPAVYFPRARRCFAFNTTVRVQDDATGTFQDHQVYIDPDDYIAGGCIP